MTTVKPVQPSPIAEALKATRLILVGVFLVSGIINILTLTGSLFMMQVYDRVLGSQSIPTLILLALIAVVAYTFQGVLDIIRSRILSLAGERVDEVLAPKIMQALVDLPLRVARGALETLQPFRDVEAIRAFVGGPAAIAMFDMPWVPIYLGVLFLLHPWLCYLTIAGTLVLVCLTILTEITSKAPSKQASESSSKRNLYADQMQKNAEVVRAMGMHGNLSSRWSVFHVAAMDAQRQAAYRSGLWSGLSKIVRMILQSAVLGLGAYLVIKGEMSSGAIIAGTILSGKAMAPIDQAIGSWKVFVAARQAHGRLKQMLSLYPPPSQRFELPAPKQSLIVEAVTLVPPGGRQPVVRGASLALSAGQALGLIGPSASGKTSLVRGIVGLWAPAAGRVMLDGASLDQWQPDQLGPSIGYLPQDVQLFDGTIAENIARFASEINSDLVIEAAQTAGFHEFILGFADGYNTRVGQSGMHLSAGQRQRLGLARALYGRPFLVVLDEPNANLDAEGEAAVVKAISMVKARDGIVVVVAHRPSAIAVVDMLAAMKGGQILAFGPRDEVLAKVMAPQQQQQRPQQQPQGAASPAGGPQVIMRPGLPAPQGNAGGGHDKNS